MAAGILVFEENKDGVFKCSMLTVNQRLLMHEAADGPVLNEHWLSKQSEIQRKKRSSSALTFTSERFKVLLSLSV